MIMGLRKKRMAQPDQKSNKSMNEIRQRKKKLRDDLDFLESGFENRISKVSSMIPGNLNPVETIRKHPLKSVGLSILLGAVAGVAFGSGKKKRRNSEEIESDSASSQGFSSMVFNELKRVAAFRTASYISEMLENSLAGDKESYKK